MAHPARSEPRPADASTPGRRERKKRATRVAVREAALELAIRDGVENVTVEQIATHADIAVRTFFNHYSSKEEAVIAAAEAGAEELIAEFRKRPPEESVLEALRGAVLVAMQRDDAAGRDHVKVLRLIRRAPTLIPRQMAVLTAQESALSDAIAERLDVPASVEEPGTGVPTGAVRASARGKALYPHLCAAAALAALRVALDRWLDQATNDEDPPPLSIFRDEIDSALTQLATGLDRTGGAGPGHGA